MSLTTANDALPTDSHALAAAGEGEVLTLDTEAGNLGWHMHPDEMANPIIEGIDNEELWMLLRRFNKQLFHVKAVDDVPGDLDLHIRTDEEFEPDKMRANIERLYMTVIVGMMNVAKHVARLRSWNERRRTTTFCITYFAAWWFDLLVPLILSVILVMILYPPARSTLFPPMPLALVDVNTGTIQRPRAGKLASGDSITGAPEKHPGEAVEQEASNFVTGVASIALSGATEAKTRDLENTSATPSTSSTSDAVPGAFENVIPAASDVATTAAEAQSAAAGDTSDVKHDKTKVPMQQMMWEQARPFMHILAEICDTWERFGNALSARPPFPKDKPRYKLASAIAPILLVSLFLNAAAFVKGSMFAFGAGFFGWPIIWRALDWLNLHYPKWQRVLELRNTLLRGIPTNAQLTITLLRIGEARKLPIPPPPIATTPPSSDTEQIIADDLPLNVSQTELNATLRRQSTTASVQEQAPKKTSKKAKLVSFARFAAKTGVESLLGADRFKAVIGAEHARNRLGILPRQTNLPMGPVDFNARYKGKRGRLFVLTSATTPCIAFSPSINPRDGTSFTPLWTVAIEDIVNLCKVGGLGWKAKLVVGWAMDTHVADALAVTDKLGNRYVLTAMQMRDELFNRLVAMGTQKWEVQ